MIHGFDASSVQGQIPWEQLDPALRFTFFKAYQGNDGKDPNFQKNVAECKASGRIAGAYFFAYPLPHLDPREQARTFFEQCGEFGTNVGELPPVIDLEWPPPNEWAKWKCTPQQISDWSATHLAEVTKLWQRHPILYIYDWWWETLAEGADVSWATEYALFMAWYTNQWPGEGSKPKIPVPFSSALFWQFDGNGGLRLPNGVDSDFCVFEGSEEELQALAAGPRLREETDFDIIHPGIEL